MENAREMWKGCRLPHSRIPWSAIMNPNCNLKTATLIGSDKGGIGKSMIAMIVALAHDRAGRPLKIIEIDHQAKLRSVLGDRVDLSLKAGSDLADVAKVRPSAASFHEPLYPTWSGNAKPPPKP